MQGAMLKKIHGYLKLFGINLKVFALSIAGLPVYLRNFNLLKKQIEQGNNEFPLGDNFPCLSDRYEDAGVLPLHYLHQDRYVASRIFQLNPEKHVDIGSRIDGFIASVSVFRTIEVFDIRPVSYSLPNVVFRQADLMDTGRVPADYCDSLSSLHAIEHFGLGRYGDPVNINGHKTAIESIYQMLKPGGRFYFSVPIGKQRIEYDAHRVFSVSYLLELFQSKFEVDRFSFIDDENTLHENAELNNELLARVNQFTFGCGIFELIKK